MARYIEDSVELRVDLDDKTATLRDLGAFYVKSNTVSEKEWHGRVHRWRARIRFISRSELASLNLSESEQKRVKTLEVLVREPFSLFTKNYPLLNKYAVGICNTPELAAIPIGEPVEFFGMWFGGKSSADLGKLLALYAFGVLRGKPCTACGSSETLIYQNAGSMLSGSTFLSASVCLECRNVFSNSTFDRNIVLASLKYERIAPFRHTKTRWTMSALIHALKALELEEQK